MSEKEQSGATGNGGCGCLSCLTLLVIAWALAFGFTVGGVHYGIGFSCERGVEVSP